jgi:phosphohistidine phosphatase
MAKEAEMTVYLMRHARAARREEWQGEDEARPLTDKGRREAKNAARFLGRHCSVDLILSSTYDRAAETARIVRGGFEPAPPLQMDARLEPGLKLEGFKTLIGKYADRDAILVVGHDPDFTRLVSDLAGGGNFALDKGGLARVSLDTGAWEAVVEWLLAPDLYED